MSSTTKWQTLFIDCQFYSFTDNNRFMGNTLNSSLAKIEETIAPSCENMSRDQTKVGCDPKKCNKLFFLGSDDPYLRVVWRDSFSDDSWPSSEIIIR